MGKTVLITGGTKGLGKELALAFARNGSNVVMNYYNDVSRWSVAVLYIIFI